MNEAERATRDVADLVGCVEPVAERREDVREDRDGQSLVMDPECALEARERLTLDVLHRDEELAVVLSGTRTRARRCHG